MHKSSKSQENIDWESQHCRVQYRRHPPSTCTCSVAAFPLLTWRWTLGFFRKLCFPQFTQKLSQSIFEKFWVALFSCKQTLTTQSCFLFFHLNTPRKQAKTFKSTVVVSAQISCMATRLCLFLCFTSHISLLPHSTIFNVYKQENIDNAFNVKLCFPMP